MMYPDYKKHAEAQSNPAGLPKSNPDTPPAKVLPLCSKCYCVVWKGASHNCTKVQKQANLVGFVKATSSKTKGKVTSTVLRSICTETGVTLRGGKLTLATGGAPIDLHIGNPRRQVKKPRFTLESLKRLQAATNVSDRTIK